MRTVRIIISLVDLDECCITKYLGVLDIDVERIGRVAFIRSNGVVACSKCTVVC